MRTFFNLGATACLLSLIAVNLAFNPFLSQATAQSGGGPCGGSPPDPDCTCCEGCGCWICE